MTGSETSLEGKNIFGDRILNTWSTGEEKESCLGREQWAQKGLVGVRRRGESKRCSEYLMEIGAS